MLHSLDFVMPVQKAIPDKLCKSLIKKFEESKELHVKRDSTIHQFNELNLSETEGFEYECNQLQTVAKYLMDFYKKELHVKYFPTSYRFEEFRMKRYDPNDNDQFDWHADVGDYASARRFMVCFMYLNDVEVGGETMFDWGESDINAIKIKPEEGTAVMFPPMWTHPHKGAMPLSGPKYIVSTYAHFI
jgi:hypothetical protein